MAWPQCNTTLENERLHDEEHVWHGMTFHHFGLILSALFGLIAVLTSSYLIWRHTTHYLKPWEQRHIVRILFMVPIYATVSFLSYAFYWHAIYFEVVRDCYEAFAIASFFALLCHYIAPDLHSQKDYFRSIKPKPWVWPLNWFAKCCSTLWRTPRSGLTWFNIIYFGVFQYCFVRVFMTVVAVVSEAAGRYCLASLHPAFAHIWVMVIEGGCVTIAMYCLIQFYVQLKDDLAEHSPLLKVAAIKLVIFLSFWQTILISFLTSSGAIKPSQRFQGPDLRIGIPSLLLCIEMAIFSIFHLFAFPWQVYDIRRSAIVASESVPGYLPDPKTAYLGGPLGSKALLDAFNPWDLVKAIGRGFRWFVVGRRNREQDVSYQAYKISRPLNPDASDIDGMGNGRNRMPSGPFTPGGISKQGRYHQVKGGPDEDDRRLLSHQQSVPLSSSKNIYPRPGMRLPDERDLYDSSSSLHSHARSDHHMPTHTNHMRHPSNLNPPYPTGQNQQIGIHDPNPAFHHQYQEQDTSYHGASSSFSHPSPYNSSIINNNNGNPNERISLTSTTSDPDDWRDWSGAHGPHNQSDVARLSGEHIAQARLSAEQERRSMQRSRRGSEESGRSSAAPERVRAQRLSAIGRPSGESSRSGVSGKRGEEGEGLGVRDEGRERERSRGKSPSEVWRGMQRGGGAGGEFD